MAKINKSEIQNPQKIRTMEKLAKKLTKFSQKKFSKMGKMKK